MKGSLQLPQTVNNRLVNKNVQVGSGSGRYYIYLLLRSGSATQDYGYADPDPKELSTDPQHGFSINTLKITFQTFTQIGKVWWYSYLYKN
jgi:hypothetical protein